jgi:hypothetical protein
MSKELQNFLIDLLDAVDPFKDVVTNIMVRDVNGIIIAAAKARDGSISIQAKSKHPIPDFTEKACLGSLPFLRGVLTSAYMKDGTLSLAYGKASNDDDIVLRSMKMVGSNGFNVFFQAIDPFVNKLNRIKLPTGLSWPVAFAVDGPFINHFSEVVKVNTFAPKSGTGSDDIFELLVVDGTIEGVFGDNKHQTNVVLSNTVESDEVVDKINAYFSITKTRSMLRFIGKGSAIGYLSDKALRIDTDTACAEYQFVTASKKVRADVMA